jgi:hypothetical protein
MELFRNRIRRPHHEVGDPVGLALVPVVRSPDAKSRLE